MITPQQIIHMVDACQDEAIQCLQEAVQTPSPTGEELAISRLFTRWIADCGLTVEQYEAEPGRPNLIAQWHGSRPGKRFLFNGHLDVFPPSDGDGGWYGPWSGKIADGFLYGRGAVDMKGGDCAALMAVRLLRRMNFDPKGSVILSYMVDEENGGWKGVRYLIDQGLLKADVGLCMEPTNGRILHRHRGILRMKFTYRAQPHHASTPHPTCDALQKAVTAIQRLYALNETLRDRTDEFGAPSRCLSVTMLHAGNTPNVQPGLAEFVVDRRVDLDEDPERVKGEILDIFDGLERADPEYHYAYSILSDRPVLTVPADDPFILSAARSYEKIMGRPAKLYTRAGGSDAASLYQAYRLPIPNLGAAPDFDERGAADPFGSGTPNERLRLSDYLDSIKYYMMIVADTLS
ncbi:M20/M25/M40 family metallo-hydrolase [Pseudoflavonifractor sp. 60]|uniref:M20/M25/M40 family metallo-hydrolase n=1 Tax=Pseudoflavonifractor sp. 60 TaxID=2304576 RepID=UPI001369DCC7